MSASGAIIGVAAGRLYSRGRSASDEVRRIMPRRVPARASLLRQVNSPLAKPALFVGSSSEGLDFARAVRSLLVTDAEFTLWNEGFFLVGNTYAMGLVNSLQR